MQVIYVAGPFMALSDYEVQLNIASAGKVGLECAKKGWSPIIPHKNTGGFENCDIHPEDTSDEDFWYEATMELLRKADAVVMCPGWLRSHGSQMEFNAAKDLGIPVYETVEQVPDLFQEEGRD